MTKTGPADAIMAACARTATGWPALGRPGSRSLDCAWPASREPTVTQAVFPGPASFKPANRRLAGRSVWRWPGCPPLRL
jgi:hypothetical protein